MQTTQEATVFEFLLTMENNIIIQRYFDVYNYNPKAKKSLNLYYWITDVCTEIQDLLKIKNLEYMTDNYHYVTDNETNNTNEPIKEEYFKLELKKDNEVFINRIFPAHVYHPKARYCDIRPKIRKMLYEITMVLSSRDLEKKYLKYDLK